MQFTSKLISFRLVLFNGRGELGRLPSLILSASDMESEWDRSSELDDEEENDTLRHFLVAVDCAFVVYCRDPKTFQKL
jgi:hypothetical protein